jgi:hypothetical protein
LLSATQVWKDTLFANELYENHSKKTFIFGKEQRKIQEAFVILVYPTLLVNYGEYGFQISHEIFVCFPKYRRFAIDSGRSKQEQISRLVSLLKRVETKMLDARHCQVISCFVEFDQSIAAIEKG